MKILADENLDETFPELMPHHDVTHVIGAGWQGLKNGVLLEKASAWISSINQCRQEYALPANHEGKALVPDRARYSP